MKEEELGDRENVVGMRQKSKSGKEAKKFEEVIEEGGQEEEEEYLTHWIMPDDVFRTFVDEDYKDEDIEDLREWADEGNWRVEISYEDLLAY